MLSRAAAAITFILKRPVTDATERMLKLLTRTNIGGLKAAPPPQRQSLYSHVIHTKAHRHVYAYYSIYTDYGTLIQYGVISLNRISTIFSKFLCF